MQRAESGPNNPGQDDGTPYDMISLESLGSFMLFGDIDGYTAYTACNFIIKANMLQPNSDPLTMFLNTGGGGTNDGFSIIDIMETSRLPVQTVGTGLIASMGLLILAAGAKGSRVLTKNTEVMAHQWSAYGIDGVKFHELVAMSAAHARLKQTFINHFLRHSTMTEKQINDIVFAPSDRWLTPQECKKYGLVDRVTEFLEVPKPKPPKSPKSVRVKKLLP